MKNVHNKNHSENTKKVINFFLILGLGILKFKGRRHMGDIILELPSK